MEYQVGENRTVGPLPYWKAFQLNSACDSFRTFPSFQQGLLRPPAVGFINKKAVLDGPSPEGYHPDPQSVDAIRSPCLVDTKSDDLDYNQHLIRIPGSRLALW